MSFGTIGVMDVHARYLVCTRFLMVLIRSRIELGADTYVKLTAVKFTTVARKGLSSKNTGD